MATPVRRLVAIFKIEANKRPMVDANREIDKGKEKAKDTEDAVKKLNDAFKKFGITLGVGYLLNKVRQFTTDFIAAADALDKTGQQVGISTDQLQAFRHAADLSGVSAGEFDQTIGQLQRNMREFTRGSASMRDAFNDLGVDVTDESGRLRDAGDVIYDIANAMKNIEDPAARVGLSMTVFGRSGRRMLPMLINGADALRAMTDELGEYGGGISRQAISQSVLLVDTIARFRLAMRSFASSIMVEVLPGFTQFIISISRAVVWVKEAIDNSRILESTAIAAGAALAAVGIATAASWGPAALTVGLTTAAVLVAALAIDDLWVTMEGGQSVTRTFIDEMLGVGATTQMVNNLKQGWVDLGETIATAWEYIRPMIEWIIEKTETAISTVGRLAAPAVRFLGGGPSPEEEAMAAREEERIRRRNELWERGRAARQRRAEAGAAAGETLAPPSVSRTAGATIARGARRGAPARTQPATAAPATMTQEQSLLERSLIMPGVPLGGMPTTIQPQVTQQRQQVNQITATTTVGPITVQAAQNPEETARAIDRRIRQREGETIRRVQASLVPAAERG